MFISNTEKQKIFTLIQALEVRVIELEGRPISEPSKPRRIMSEEQKEHMSKTMKAIHARKKSEKMAGVVA
jgi:hypothetical protein